MKRYDIWMDGTKDISTQMTMALNFSTRFNRIMDWKHARLVGVETLGCVVRIIIDIDDEDIEDGYVMAGNMKITKHRDLG